jgi:uncharacterized protein
MDPKIAVQTIKWAFELNQQINNPGSTLRVSFHGGEPLLAGIDFFRNVYRGWNKYAIGDVNFEVQSNLWLLTEDFCRLFGQHQTLIGTSLDGPQEICDAQRGNGYYEKTKRGMELALFYRTEISCISTITPQSLNHLQSILTFFVNQRQNVNFYGAVQGLNINSVSVNNHITPSELKNAYVSLFDKYIDVANKIRIEFFDRCCRALISGRHPTCLFCDCLGQYFAVDYEGWLYPCVRCVGLPRYRYCNIIDKPSYNDIASSALFKRLDYRRKKLRDECGDCSFWSICMGGCFCNWEVSSKNNSFKDPYCLAYKGLYSHILDYSL